MAWIVGGAVLGSAILGKMSADKNADAITSAADTQGYATDRAIQFTEQGIDEGRQYLDPYTQLGQQGIDQAGFLTDPQAQFDFLQNNPLFKLALQNANTETNQMAASRSRLSAGDTLQRLSDNVLLSSSPLISGQKNSIMDLLNIGNQTAGRQANLSIGGTSDISNLITQGGNAEAAGIIGASNAKTAGTQNLLNSGLLAGSLFMPGGGSTGAASTPSFLSPMGTSASTMNIGL